MTDPAAHTAAAANVPLPPQNLDAEESVLGAMLLSPAAIDAVAQELDPADFYRQSHARIYRAALTLHQLGQPVDAITVADRLEEQGQLHDVGGKERIHELAAITPAAGNAAHYARIVNREARRRQLLTTGELLIRRSYESADPDQLHQQALELLTHTGRNTAAAPIEGLTHREVLELHIEADRQLVDDLIPAGAVGTIAGVPESHKSWLAQAIAVRVAAGTGYILGKQVVSQGPVGYFWQDDSTREEAERVKAFEQAHQQAADLPLTWYLNQGLQLPRDIPRIRAAIDQNHYALIVLDSFYNFLAGIDLKDESAEQVVSQLKRDLADPTGATILIVDHMPWATDTNRQRLRAYGGVFKNAATRYGIYIDAIGDKLHIEARGNNIRGITRTLAAWNPDRLELYLITNEHLDRDDLLADRTAQIIQWLEANPGRHTTTTIREAVGGNTALTTDALDNLLADGRIRDQAHNGGNYSGKRGTARYWIASIHAPQSDTGVVLTLPENHSEPLSDANWFPAPTEPLRTTSETEPPATQDESFPAAASPPYRGEADREPLRTPTQKVEPGPREPLLEAQTWIDDNGWMTTDPAAHLLEHWPTLGAHDITTLVERARTLAAAEAAS